MKAVPILIITNALALGLGLMAYLHADDIQAQRGSNRQSSSRATAEGNDYYDAQIADLKREIARLSADRGLPPGDGLTDAGAMGSDADSGAAIDRTVASPETFDETLEMERPGFDYFRDRVRLAQDENEKEDRVNREIDRLETLISSNRIGTLSNTQKKAAAQTLIENRSKTRLIWRGLRESINTEGMSREDQRTAFRDAYRKQADEIKVETMKSLETVMPAADAETLLENSRGDFGGRAGGTTRTRRTNRAR